MDDRGPGAHDGRRVLAFVAAHPDDDVMGVVGIVAGLRDDPGLRFVLVHATDGEAGEIAPGSGATRATLGAVRREEDRAGWRVVGREPDRHEWFGLPDGGLADLPDGLLADRIATVFATERPDVVVSAGPDGISGHPDHVAVGRATTDAFLRFAGDDGPGFRRLLHAAVPQSALDRHNAWLEAAGRRPHDPTRVYDLRGVPDETIACSVDQLEHVEVVEAAFREHRTQWAPPWSEQTPEGWRWAAGASHFVMAWPDWVPGTPRLQDVFADLGPGS
ncbi:PIG-L deacetylase family protein [Salsipaludibacter albus]|uniref:PIG-L deacetylase family protein n=1 Tax=Salsipaludibacter albus TaxID=2849650 RepID=UPI001EE4618D|nr:PIG-L family deacetylase [Salsipaludibacter albus]MBY5162762.1 PIG-L family deacetylase [Salsipaludibacter albus]